MSSLQEKRIGNWLDSHAWWCGVLLAIGCALLALGLFWVTAKLFPGLAFSADRPIKFWETLRLPVLFCAYLSATMLACSAVVRKYPITSWPIPFLAALALVLAMAVRWATPDMALDLSPRPDGLHYAALASRVTTSGQWTIPVGPFELPSRFSPATSLLLAMLQWMRPDHLGAGVAIIWLTGGLAIALLWLVGSIAFSKRIGAVAAILLAASPSYGHYARQLMSEIPWSLFILMALACIYLARERRCILFAGGVLLALGMLFKPPHAAVVAGVGASYLVRMACCPRNRWRNAFLIGGGFCAGIVPWFLYNRMVLGGWLLSGYQIFDSNLFAVDAVFGLQYLLGPTAGKGFTGNLIYYPMALLGLELRIDRMLFAMPVALLVLAGIAYRARRRLRADPISEEGRWLLWGAACSVALYMGMFLIFSCQSARYLLPVLPLICLWAAVAIDPLVARIGPDAQRLLLAVMIVVSLAMGASILHVELEGRRHASHAEWKQLEQIMVDFDVLVTDEDPAALGFYGIWTREKPVIPIMPEGSDWFDEDPHAMRQRTGAYLTPYRGLENALIPFLESNKRIAVWLVYPRAHRVLLDFLSPEYELEPLGAGLPNGYRLVRSGSDVRNKRSSHLREDLDREGD